MDTFEEYLAKKKIDAAKFATAERAHYERLKLLFEQVHPNSFTMQQLFVLNKLRKMYHAG